MQWIGGLTGGDAHTRKQTECERSEVSQGENAEGHTLVRRN